MKNKSCRHACVLRKLALSAEPPLLDKNVEMVLLKFKSCREVKIENFDDPFEAFYWLGACAVTREAPPQKAPLEDVAEFVVFDTETSGLSSRDVAVQVCLGFYDGYGKALGFYDKLWKPPRGVVISKGSIQVHGITNARVFKEGLDARFELPKVHAIFKKMRSRGKKIVAHNAAFDVRILRQTARSHSFAGWDLEQSHTFCTMNRAAPRCGLKSKKTGRARKPKNAELYRILTGKAPSGALHDAQVDVGVTAKNYTEGRHRGWWA